VHEQAFHTAVAIETRSGGVQTLVVRAVHHACDDLAGVIIFILHHLKIKNTILNLWII